MANEISRRRAICVAGSLFVAGCAPDEPKEETKGSINDGKPTGGVAEAWDRIHNWLSLHAPKILAALNPPATDIQIAAAEKAFGITMPDEWRELYRVHNGMNQDPNPGSLFFGMNFLTLERAILEYGLNAKPDTELLPAKAADRGIRTEDMHNRKWIAIAHDFGSSLVRVDMDPAPAGHVGQVIFTDYDSDVTILLAQNVGQLLWDFVGDLEANRYFLNEEALANGEEFLSPVPEIDVINWSRSPRWKHLDK